MIIEFANKFQEIKDDLLSVFSKTEPDNYWSGNYLAPIGYAVSKNKIDWVKLLINSGVNVNDEAYVYGKGYESYYRMNLLSIASDDKMADLLKKSGINTIASIAWDSYCKDDNVRLRASYSINSEVIGKINQ